MKSLLFIILLFPFVSYGQISYVVVDSTTKEPIPYALIYFNETGKYTNEKGEFKINSQKIDTLEVESLGYTKKKIIVNKEKSGDTIFLEKKSFQLPAVVIKASVTPINIALGKRAKSFGSFPISPQQTIFAIIYPKEKYANYKIKKMTFSFRKRLNGKSRRALRRNGVNALVRFHIYSINRNQLSQSIFNSRVIKINPYEDDQLSINLTNENILFSKEGIGVELEFIKFSSNAISSDKIKSKLYIRPVLTDRENNYFKEETFYKSTFKNGNDYIIPINSIFNDPKLNHKKKYFRNLSIGLELN